MRSFRQSTPAAGLRILCLLAGLAVAAPLHVAGQADSVTIVAGPQYEAGGVKAVLLGRDYRDLWTEPVTVPVLDLDTFAGGLSPVQRGGGLQTISIRFRAADGREYNFRSVDKHQEGGLHPDFHDTLVGRLAQDQVSSKHPGAALIAGPLQDAAGVMHPDPRLYVMPDDPRLGEFRELFAGMLGTIEVHPDEGPDDEPTFHDAVRVIGTERLLEHLEESAVSRVDATAYLRARLVDFLIGDWDRHPGQWRWARYDEGDVRWWVAVPEDRDNAFASYDGLLLDLIRRRAPRLVEFGPTYPDVFALAENAQLLDRRLLSILPRQTYHATAREIADAVTDEVIAQALARTPPEYGRLRGEEIASALRARREALPEMADRFYDLLAGEVEIHGTDAVDLAFVEHAADGSVEVRLHSALDEEAADTSRAGLMARMHTRHAAEPYFQRRFHAAETRELRIFLQGGDDRALVRSEGAAHVLVRVIGGGGDDVLVDSTSAGGRPVAFYDHRGDNTFVRTPHTVVDRRRFEAPEDPLTGFNENAPPLRDWGSETILFQPWAGWRYNIGPVIGGGPSVVRYGFRRAPYAHMLAARLLWAPLESRVGLEAQGDFRRTNSPSHTTVRAWASQLGVTRFHGFGNETPGSGPSDLYKIHETEVGIEPLYHRAIGGSSFVFAGPIASYTRPELPAAGPAAEGDPIGASPFVRLGAQAGAALDRRDLPTYPRQGMRGTVTTSGFAGAEGLPGAFAALETEAAAYLPLPLPLETTLAVRGGGRTAWGEFPIQEAAFIGGPATLRGHPRQRYAGDAAVFAGAELRSYLTRFNFISRGDMGFIVLGDAGRVFVDGDSPGGWHTGIGGGLWFGILDRTRTFSLVAAHGEETAVYFTLGMPF